MEEVKYKKLKRWLKNAEAVEMQWDKAVSTGTTTEQANKTREKHLDMICENIINECKQGLYDIHNTICTSK